MAVFPQEKNILDIFVTLVVSNLSPKSKLVMALLPQESNILDILVTLTVLKLSPNFKLVIALLPQELNIQTILVTLLTFNKFKLVIVSVAVHISATPIFLNNESEYLFPNISSLLPICTFSAPLALFVSYHAIIDLSCCADTSHAVELTYAPVVALYTELGILDSNVTFSIFCLCIELFFKNPLV